MLGYLGGRLMLVPVTLLGLVLLVFLLVRLMPGDPAVALLGDYATAENIAAMRQEMGLDKPLYAQFFIYVRNIASGEFGESMRIRKPVSWLIASFLPHTIRLALAAMAISIFIGIPAGVIAANHHNTWVDYGVSIATIAAYSAPAFWLGLLAILLFGLRLRWFPITGAGSGSSPADVLAHLVLPATVLGLRQAALVCRMTRTSVLQTLQEDYVRTARAKGLTEAAVLFKHVLRNAAVPIVTVIGLTVGFLLGGTVVTEVVFSRPGLGRLLVTSVTMRDFQTIQGMAIIWGSMVILVNLLVDIVYSWIDPRIRYQ